MPTAIGRHTVYQGFKNCQHEINHVAARFYIANSDTETIDPTNGQKVTRNDLIDVVYVQTIKGHSSLKVISKPNKTLKSRLNYRCEKFGFSILWQLQNAPSAVRQLLPCRVILLRFNFQQRLCRATCSNEAEWKTQRDVVEQIESNTIYRLKTLGKTPYVQDLITKIIDVKAPIHLAKFDSRVFKKFLRTNKTRLNNATIAIATTKLALAGKPHFNYTQKHIFGLETRGVLIRRQGEGVIDDAFYSLVYKIRKLWIQLLCSLGVVNSNAIAVEIFDQKNLNQLKESVRKNPVIAAALGFVAQQYDENHLVAATQSSKILQKNSRIVRNFSAISFVHKQAFQAIDPKDRLVYVQKHLFKGPTLEILTKPFKDDHKTQILYKLKIKWLKALQVLKIVNTSKQAKVDVSYDTVSVLEALRRNTSINEVARIAQHMKDQAKQAAPKQILNKQDILNDHFTTLFDNLATLRYATQLYEAKQKFILYIPKNMQLNKIVLIEPTRKRKFLKKTWYSFNRQMQKYRYNKNAAYTRWTPSTISCDSTFFETTRDSIEKQIRHFFDENPHTKIFFKKMI